jgi:hypothetical protein
MFGEKGGGETLFPIYLYTGFFTPPVKTPYKGFSHPPEKSGFYTGENS